MLNQAIGLVCVEFFRKKHDHGGCETPKVDHQNTRSTVDCSLIKKGAVEGIDGEG